MRCLPDVPGRHGYNNGVPFSFDLIVLYRWTLVGGSWHYKTVLVGSYGMYQPKIRVVAQSKHPLQVPCTVPVYWYQ